MAAPILSNTLCKPQKSVFIMIFKSLENHTFCRPLAWLLGNKFCGEASSFILRKAIAISLDNIIKLHCDSYLSVGGILFFASATPHRKYIQLL